jgi:hypothetical protein
MIIIMSIMTTHGNISITPRGTDMLRKRIRVFKSDNCGLNLETEMPDLRFSSDGSVGPGRM